MMRVTKFQPLRSTDETGNGDFGLPKPYVTSMVEITFHHRLHITVSTLTVRNRKWLFTEALPKSKDSMTLLKITAGKVRHM